MCISVSSTQCNGDQGKSHKSCGESSERIFKVLHIISTSPHPWEKDKKWNNQLLKGEAALAAKRVVAPMRAALGNININTRFYFEV